MHVVFCSTIITQIAKKVPQMAKHLKGSRNANCQKKCRKWQNISKGTERAVEQRSWTWWGDKRQTNSEQMHIEAAAMSDETLQLDERWMTNRRSAKNSTQSARLFANQSGRIEVGCGAGVFTSAGLSNDERRWGAPDWTRGAVSAACAGSVCSNN